MKLRHFEVVDPFWIPFLTKWPKSVLLYTLLRTGTLTRPLFQEISVAKRKMENNAKMKGSKRSVTLSRNGNLENDLSVEGDSISTDQDICDHGEKLRKNLRFEILSIHHVNMGPRKFFFGGVTKFND